MRKPEFTCVSLSSLKSLLETGDALVIKMEPPQRMLNALKKMGIATP